MASNLASVSRKLRGLVRGDALKTELNASDAALILELMHLDELVQLRESLRLEKANHKKTQQTSNKWKSKYHLSQELRETEAKAHKNTLLILDKIKILLGFEEV